MSFAPKHIGYNAGMDPEDLRFAPYDEKYFEPIYHTQIDMGVRQVLGLPLLETYLHLKRHVWRSIEKGNPRVVEARRNGRLPVFIEQASLADSMGLALSRVKVYLGELRSLGWILTEALPGNNRMYILGYTPTGVKGRGSEIYYADEWHRELYDEMMTWAVDLHMKARLNAVPMKDRVDFCRAFISRRSARVGLRLAKP